MTYLEVIDVFKWIGYLIWAVISIGGTLQFIFDLVEDEEPHKYTKGCLILCIVSLLFFIAFIVYKVNNK